MPTSGGMLGEVQDGLLQEALANLGPEWQDQPLPAKIEEAKRRLLMMEQIDHTSEFALDKHQGKVRELEQVQQELPDMPKVNASRKVFTLKVSQFAPPTDPMQNGMEVQGEPPAQQSAAGDLPKFRDAAHLRDVLLQIGVDQAASAFGALVSINPEFEQAVDDAIGRFFETDDPQRQLELASVIYNSLPQSARESVNGAEGDTQVNGVEETVQTSNDAIRHAAVNLAKNNASKKVEAFNLKNLKTAQHKGLENVMMFGPDQVRVDPFTGQLVSKWHIQERNKGYGIRVNDALDIDFEAIWRGNIMDKYSQPYRNAEGEWVGGYINKRFEVDRMIPEGNNYQMKPGEKRRPYLPEYRSTEARLQNMRSEASDGDHKPTFANKDKPTDWSKDGTEFAAFNFKKAKSEKQASSKKKSKLNKQSDFFGQFFGKSSPQPQKSKPVGRLDLSPIDIPAQKATKPNGPQPEVDFQLNDRVEVLQNGHSTGLVGTISSWEGSGQAGSVNKPSARVRVQGIPGGTLVRLVDLRKVQAQVNLPQGGQPKDTNSLPKLPGEEPLKGGPRCSNCGTQLPNPANVSNQRKGNLTNCPMCHAPINMGGQWVNPFNQQKQTPFNQNVVITPNMQRAAQIVMPSDATVVNKTVPQSMARRTKPFAPQVQPQQAFPQTQESLMLSDENAEKKDQGHLDSVQHSANALGL